MRIRTFVIIGTLVVFLLSSVLAGADDKNDIETLLSG